MQKFYLTNIISIKKDQRKKKEGTPRQFLCLCHGFRFHHTVSVNKNTCYYYTYLNSFWHRLLFLYTYYEIFYIYLCYKWPRFQKIGLLTDSYNLLYKALGPLHSIFMFYAALTHLLNDGDIMLAQSINKEKSLKPMWTSPICEEILLEGNPIQSQTMYLDLPTIPIQQVT